MSEATATPAAAPAAAGAAQTAASTPAPVTSAPAAPVELSALGANVPASGAERATWVMAAGLVDAGVLTLEQARAQLAGQSEPAPQPAQDPASTPHGQQHATGIDPEIAAGLDSADGFARTAAASKVSLQLAGALQELPDGEAVNASVAKFYGDTLRAALESPPTFEQKIAAMAETGRHLAATYGQREAAEMVENARAEVQHLAATSIPHIHELLERSGGGNDPFVIAELARRHVERAKRQIQKGFAAKSGGIR